MSFVLMNGNMEKLSVTKRVKKYRKKVKESEPEKWEEIKKKDRQTDREREMLKHTRNTRKKKLKD